MDVVKIVFLVSGGGGTLRFLDLAIKELHLPFAITGVFSDRDCAALHYGQSIGALSQKIDYSAKDDSELNNLLVRSNPDCVVTNFHKVLSRGTLECCGAFFVNLHYSLLPAYAGYIGMKRILCEAKSQNVGFLGVTCHEVSEELDGGRILCQGIEATDWQKPDEWIKDKLFRSACLALLNSLCIRFCGLKQKREGLSVCCNMNPPLDFDPSFSTPSFWRQVSMNVLV